MDALLVQASRLHSQDMNNRQFFSHVNPDGLDPGARITNAGYVYTTWAESIAAGANMTTPAEALKDLIIDAGVPDVGHRNQLLSYGSPYNLMTQTGVGIVLGGSGPYTNYYTIDSAAPPDGRHFLTGVVFNDANGNGKYDIGEGLGGVTITVAGGGATTSFGSGGYSFQLSPGTYMVTASGGGLAVPITQFVTVGGQNVRLNFNPAANIGPQLQNWVSLLYRDVLGRTAGAGEVNGWVAALEQGFPRSAVVSIFVNSPEYDARQVTRLFQQYLHRAPDPAGLSSFVQWMQLGVSEVAVRQAILSSPEYWNDNGGNAAGFVQGLYHDLLGRSISGGEANGWINLAASGNRAAVISSILYSAEFDAVTVNALFETYLRRAADPSGLNAFVGMIQFTRPQHFDVEFLLASNEYFNGSQSW
jgi:hypothetical protein